MRRRALVLGLSAWLSGCGFHPVYQGGAAQTGLAEITVANIPNRPGQELRQALQARFERSGPGTARRYDLIVAYNLASEGISLQPDSSVTRTRLVGTASWYLVAQDTTRTVTTTGSARSVDGVDVVNNQFFALDLDAESAQRRVAEAIADQITLQLASYFRENTGKL
jgi:LPS-assembly lipoprotein